MDVEYKQNDNTRMCKSESYNWVLNKDSGFFARWGKNMDDDPELAPAPELLDIEISTICSRGCKMCYKSNTCKGTNMTFDQFVQIFKTFGPNLTQIAFGIGDIDGNPDLYKILAYTKMNGVMPNITINGSRMTDYDYKMLAGSCGAVAVSHYDDDECFNAVAKLVEHGVEQVNIHQVLSVETFNDCIDLARKAKTDPRLKGLNAIVFLWLKPKGDRNTLTPLRKGTMYHQLIEYLLKSGVGFGFDSCSANNFLEVVKEYYPDRYAELSKYAEPCESSLFSYYINVDGIAYPCSFSEGKVPGYDLFKGIQSFDHVWNNMDTNNFRVMLLNNNRSCPVYDLELTE